MEEVHGLRLACSSEDAGTPVNYVPANAELPRAGLILKAPTPFTLSSKEGDTARDPRARSPNFLPVVNASLGSFVTYALEMPHRALIWR